MYREHFGLERLPFQLTPDARFFFDSAGHKRALNTFVYGLSKGEGFVVVTGEVGAGKTTLLELVLQRLDLDSLAVARINTTQLEADSLIRFVAIEFECEARGGDKSEILAELRDRLTELFDAGTLPLLIVDEVQALSPPALEELRMLSNFQVGDQPLLQILLVGQPEFRQRMHAPDMEQLRQRVVANYHLGSLSEHEVKAYIEHRLHRAGWDGRTIFDDEAFRVVFEETGGNPRKINRLCDRLLYNAYLMEATVVDGAAAREVADEMRDEGLLVPTPAVVRTLPKLMTSSAAAVSMPVAAPAAVKDVVAIPAEVNELSQMVRLRLSRHRDLVRRLAGTLERGRGTRG